MISILIPCYNAERWIAQAIDSAIRQTYPDKEIVVADDGSTDDSLQIIKSFGEHVRWISGPNLGGNAARNRLLETSRGSWIQYLDADDWLKPEKITQQVNFLQHNPEVDVVYSPVFVEDHSADVVKIKLSPIPAPRDPWILLARWYLPQTGGSLWRKQSILDSGGWKAAQPCCQEHELYLRLLKAGQRFMYCDSPGAVYRQWSSFTVCRKDAAEVHRRKLEILNEEERFLRAQNMLTSHRLEAINVTRLEVARLSWGYDAIFARNAVKSIYRSDPKFVLRSNSIPISYKLAWRILGFNAAEKVASVRRRLLPLFKWR